MIKYYLILIGFVSAFSITQVTPIPMIISVFVFIGLLAKTLVFKKFISPFSSYIFYLYMTLFIVYLLGLFFLNGDRSTGLNHAFAYIGVIVMYHLVISLGLVNSKLNDRDVFKYVSLGVIIVSMFIIVEFVSKNFLSVDFDSYIYRSAVKEYTPIYRFGGSFLYRARGVMEESGPAAMYLLMFLPFVFYYYTKYLPNKSKRFFFSLLVLSSVTVTFSAVGYVEGFLALVICIIAYLFFEKRISFRGRRLKVTTIIGLHFITAILLFIILQIKPKYLLFFENIVKKVSFSIESGSSQSRLDRWSLAFDLFKQKPILGWGPGYTSSVVGTGSTSLYLETLVSYGIVGLIVLSIVFLYYLGVILRINEPVRYVFLFSFLVAVIHYFVISSVWFPWIWTLFALVDFTVYTRNRKGCS